MSQQEWITDGPYQWREFAGLDILSMLHVHVMCAYRMTLGPEWQARDEVDAKTRLYYVLDGSGELTCDGRRISLLPGRLYLIPANTRRDYACEHLELFWCHFSMRLHSGPGFFEDAAPVLEFAPDDPGEVCSLFEKLAAGFDTDATSAVVARSGLLLQIVAPFFDFVDPLELQRRHSAMEPFQAVLSEMEARLHEPIDVPALATRISMSPAHFSRRFSDVFGIPPGHYMLRRRIEEAQLRLVRTDDKLETIGVDLGFCDGFHFSKTFKKLTGISPSRYRKMVQQP